MSKSKKQQSPDYALIDLEESEKLTPLLVQEKIAQDALIKIRQDILLIQTDAEQKRLIVDRRLADQQLAMDQAKWEKTAEQKFREMEKEADRERKDSVAPFLFDKVYRQLVCRTVAGLTDYINNSPNLLSSDILLRRLHDQIQKPTVYTRFNRNILKKFALRIFECSIKTNHHDAVNQSGMIDIMPEVGELLGLPTEVMAHWDESQLVKSHIPEPEQPKVLHYDTPTGLEDTSESVE